MMFLISSQKRLLFLLDAPGRGTSNEYPHQYMLPRRNKKNNFLGTSYLEL